MAMPIKIKIFWVLDIINNFSKKFF
jgi:hypothetical protein